MSRMILERGAKHPFIVQDPRICAGVPTVKGTRIRVMDIALEYDRLGWSPDEIVRQHPHVTLSQIHDALSYYYEHQATMDRHFKDNLAAIAKMKRHYPSKLTKRLG